MGVDAICSTSTSSQWDEIFAESTHEILGVTIRIHAGSGGYLPLGTTVDDINGNEARSIEYFGNRIGGQGYGARLKARVSQACFALS